MLPPPAFFKPSGDPLVNLAGAYIPAWFVASLAGLAAVWLACIVVGRAGVPGLMRPKALMWPAVFIAASCGTWLLFFAAS